MKTYRCIFTGLIFLTTSLVAGDLTGLKIMEMVDNRPKGEDMQCSMKMTLTNKRGQERIRELVVCSKDYGNEKKSLTFFLKPSDVKGTGFLSFDYDDENKEDDRWLYLPALRKTKRISGSSNNDRFMGSDFTFKDWGERNVNEDTHTLLKEEELENSKCWVVQSVPLDKDDVYGKFISWIDQDTLLVKKAEYYDQKGELIKKFQLLDFAKVDGYWTSVTFRMKDVQRTHETMIEQTDFAFDQGLKDSIFRASALERGRIR